jgi:hypothetical protein
MSLCTILERSHAATNVTMVHSYHGGCIADAHQYPYAGIIHVMSADITYHSFRAGRNRHSALSFA